MMTGRGRILTRQQTMQQFAQYLGTQLGAPCIDRTKIPGKHDLTLHYSPEGIDAVHGRAADPTDAPDLFAAIQSQLGLRLERSIGPVEMLVIDKADKVPVPN